MFQKAAPRRHFVITVVALETYNDDTLGLKAHSASFNARMIYDRPVLIRSSCHSRCSFSCLRIWYALEDSGLNAFFPHSLVNNLVLSHHGQRYYKNDANPYSRYLNREAILQPFQY